VTFLCKFVFQRVCKCGSLNYACVCEIYASTSKGLGNVVHAGKKMYAIRKGLLRRTTTKVQTGWLAANCSTRQKMSLLYLSYSSPCQPAQTSLQDGGKGAGHMTSSCMHRMTQAPSLADA